MGLVHPVHTPIRSDVSRLSPHPAHHRFLLDKLLRLTGWATVLDNTISYATVVQQADIRDAIGLVDTVKVSPLV